MEIKYGSVRNKGLTSSPCDSYYHTQYQLMFLWKSTSSSEATFKSFKDGIITFEV